MICKNCKKESEPRHYGLCDNCWENDPISGIGGFTRNQLKTAFELVQPKTHWKDRIDSYCTSDEIKTIGIAIRFFTMTEAQFTLQGELKGKIIEKWRKEFPRFNTGDYIFHVSAIGYRAGPAGDY